MNRKIYLITGASSELGIAFLKALPLNSEDVIIAHYHSSKRELEELAFKRGMNMKLIQADFSNEEERANFVNQVEFQGIVPTHILHTSSLRPQPGRFKNLSPKDFETAYAVQVLSIVELLQRLLPQMVRNGSGKIIFVLSSSILNKPPSFLTDYVVSKYALHGLMKSLVAEYADKPIQINAVSPSMIETKFLSHFNEKVVELSAKQSPMKRNLNVSDVVPALLFLLSDSANCLNGANISITGGGEF